MDQLCSLPPIPPGGCRQPVGDEVTQWTGVAAAGNATIQTAVRLQLQHLLGKGLRHLLPVMFPFYGGAINDFPAGY